VVVSRACTQLDCTGLCDVFDRARSCSSMVSSTLPWLRQPKRRVARRDRILLGMC
jgi:hypothetical protein